MIVVLGIAVVFCVGAASADVVTPMYTFESGLQGFVANPLGAVPPTVTLNTDTHYVSEGLQSMKVELRDMASFEGVLTEEIDTDILNDPPGVDYIRFDLINTNRFAPADPLPGDPTFADLGVCLFGEFPDDPGVNRQIQFFFTQQPVGDLEPGTHQVDIDMTAGGWLIGTGTIKGFDAWIADGFTMSSFELYINKSMSVGDPAFAWTFYLDNIRTGIITAGNGGDYNGDGIVDAADYTVWRDNLAGGVGPDGDGTTTGDLLGVPDGVVDEWDYDYWKQEFGNVVGGSGSGVTLGATAVPEPDSVLLALAGAGLSLAGFQRGRTRPRPSNRRY